MGGGEWTRTSFSAYAGRTKGASLDSAGRMVSSMSAQEMFKSRKLPKSLDPLNVMRECADSDEHPNTKPVILALDVTGSMGQTAVEVAKTLNVIMTDLYEKVDDIEFCIMGIGDLYCDHAPIQISQFESDIRIAEQLDQIYFEFGGGGNEWESYTAAWYMGLHHTKLDCWNRGQKGTIITLGDERLNPVLEKEYLSQVTGDTLQADVKTKELFESCKEKFNIYHIFVDHRDGWDEEYINKSFSCLGQNFEKCSLNDVSSTISKLVLNSIEEQGTSYVMGYDLAHNTEDGISW